MFTPDTFTPKVAAQFARMTGHAEALGALLEADILSRTDGLFPAMTEAMHAAAEEFAASRGLKLTNGLFYGALLQSLTENAIGYGMQRGEMLNLTPAQQADEAVILIMALGSLATTVAANHFRDLVEATPPEVPDQSGPAAAD